MAFHTYRCTSQAFPADIASMDTVLEGARAHSHGLIGQRTGLSSASHWTSEGPAVLAASTMGQVGDNDRAGLDTGMGPPVEQMGATALLGRNVGGGREHQQYYSLVGQQTRASGASRMASEETTVRTSSTMGQVGDNDRAGLDTGMGPPVEQMGAMALLGQNVGGGREHQPLHTGNDGTRVAMGRATDQHGVIFGIREGQHRRFRPKRLRLESR